MNPLTKLLSAIALFHAPLFATLHVNAAIFNETREFRPAEIGAHHRIMERTIAETPTSGVRTRVERYQEIGTGLHWQNASGVWEETREEFEVTDDGYAQALRGPHKVTISPAINDSAGSVEIVTTDGLRLRGTVLGLALYDRVSGKAALIAEVTNALGRLVAPNTVTFTDCFDGLQADVRMVYEKAGFHQDVLLKERIDSAWISSIGFDAGSSDLQLEIWTPTAILRTLRWSGRFSSNRAARCA